MFLRIASWILIIFSIPVLIGYLLKLFGDEGTDVFETLMVVEIVLLGPLGLLYLKKRYQGGVATILGTLAVGLGIMFIPQAFINVEGMENFYVCLFLAGLFIFSGVALLVSGHKHHRLKST